MIKALIVEDEKPAARQIVTLLELINKEIQVIDIIDNTEDLFNRLRQSPLPDIIFSDIQLGDGLSFEAYEKLEHVPPIVFTTAYDEYAIKAFQWNSIDYLVKPLKQEALQKAVDKFQTLRLPQVPIDFHALLESITNKTSSAEKILIHRGEQILAIDKSEIALAYTTNKIVYIQTLREKFIIHQNLEELEVELGNQLFFRINRQTLVNRKSIKSAEPTLNNGLKLHLNCPSEIDIKVSRRRVNEFKKWWAS